MESDRISKNITLIIGKHLLLIASFYMVPYLFGAHDVLRLPDFGRPRERIEFVGYTLMLVFLYLNFYALVPRLFLKRKYLQYSIITIACVAFVLAFPYFFAGDVDRSVAPMADFRPGNHVPQDLRESPPFKGPHFRRPPISILLKHNLTFFAMCFLATMFWHSRRRSSQLETEMKNAEMAYLRAQMNPHFMFNSLNSAYGLAISEGADKTSDSLLKLSDMMRYLLVQANKERVKLEDELKYIGDYVNFQRLRLTDNVELNCDIQQPPKKYKIAPMLLLPFVENAFKHGVSTDQNCAIDVKIQFADATLFLDVRNDHVDAVPADRERSGFGFEGTKKRLELIYPSRYKLEMTDDYEHFRVQLSIQLT